MNITQAEYDALAARGHLPKLDKAAKSKSPYKNKTEQQMAWLLDDEQKAGRCIWWAYEPVTLVIVDSGGEKCRYTPDFMVVRETITGALKYEFIEVKGWCREAARIRFLAARERYPFFCFRMVQKNKQGQFNDIK